MSKKKSKKSNEEKIITLIAKELASSQNFEKALHELLEKITLPTKEKWAKIRFKGLLLDPMETACKAGAKKGPLQIIEYLYASPEAVDMLLGLAANNENEKSGEPAQENKEEPEIQNATPNVA